MQYDPMQYDLVNERLKHSVKESFLSPIKEEMEGGKKKKEIVVSGCLKFNKYQTPFLYSFP